MYKVATDSAVDENSAWLAIEPSLSIKQQRARFHRDAILIVSGIGFFPKNFGYGTEHCAPIEAKQTGRNGANAVGANLKCAGRSLIYHLESLTSVHPKIEVKMI